MPFPPDFRSVSNFSQQLCFPLKRAAKKAKMYKKRGTYIRFFYKLAAKILIIIKKHKK
jgi:hypothetical protein